MPVIVVHKGRPVCRKLRDVRAGESIVCGHEGIRVTPEFRERDRLGFAFMSNDVSSERRVEGVVARSPQMMREVRKAGGRIAVVAGPVVVHTGGVEHFSELISRRLRPGGPCRQPPSPCTTSSSRCRAPRLDRPRCGAPVEQGHRNHMAAINTINRAGGIRGGRRPRRPEVGVMYECVKHDVEYVLAGSIRDGWPLPDTEMDLIAAQERYAEVLSEQCAAGVDVVLDCSTASASVTCCRHGCVSCVSTSIQRL